MAQAKLQRTRAGGFARCGNAGLPDWVKATADSAEFGASQTPTNPRRRFRPLRKRWTAGLGQSHGGFRRVWRKPNSNEPAPAVSPVAEMLDCRIGSKPRRIPQSLAQAKLQRTRAGGLARCGNAGLPDWVKAKADSAEFGASQTPTNPRRRFGPLRKCRTAGLGQSQGGFRRVWRKPNSNEPAPAVSPVAEMPDCRIGSKPRRIPQSLAQAKLQRTRAGGFARCGNAGLPDWVKAKADSAEFGASQTPTNPRRRVRPLRKCRTAGLGQSQGGFRRVWRKPNSNEPAPAGSRLPML